jgi:hypothetical protein
LRDQSGGCSADCPGDSRCKGGTSSTWALMGNAGNLVGDAKGNDKWIAPRGRIPKHRSVEESPMVVMKAL